MEHNHTALFISDLPFMIGIHPPPSTLQNKKLTVYNFIFFLNIKHNIFIHKPYIIVKWSCIFLSGEKSFGICQKLHILMGNTTSKKRLFLPLDIAIFTKYSVPKDFFHWLIKFSMPYFIKFRETKNAYIEK